MKIVGITGPTASGKSSFSWLVKKCAPLCAVFDADKCVHRLYQNDKSVISKISQIAPGCLMQNSINRKFLFVQILKDRGLLEKIEYVVHAAVKEKIKDFLKFCRRSQIKLVVLDIPLLFKIDADVLCDKIVVVQASKMLLFQRRNNRCAKFGNAVVHDCINITKHRSKHKIIHVRSGLEGYHLYKRVNFVLGALKKR